MKRKLAGAAIAMLVAGLAAGCGGDDKGKAATTTNGSGPPLSKTEFVARADAICTKTASTIKVAAAKLRKAGAKSGTLRKTQVAKFFTDSSLPAYERQLAGLRDLTPPSGDEQVIDAQISALAGAIDKVKADPIVYASRTAVDPFAEFNTRAPRYGMKVCGS